MTAAQDNRPVRVTPTHIYTTDRQAASANVSPPAALVYWGTNREGGYHYAGRVHVVWPSGARMGECGLPVDDVWRQRPPWPTHLCPDCCLIAMAKLFPPFEIQQSPADPRGEAPRV